MVSWSNCARSGSVHGAPHSHSFWKQLPFYDGVLLQPDKSMSLTALNKIILERLPPFHWNQLFNVAQNMIECDQESGSIAYSAVCSQSASMTCVTSLAEMASETARSRMAFSPSSVRHVYWLYTRQLMFESYPLGRDPSQCALPSICLFFRLFVWWSALPWFHALKDLERLSCAARVSLDCSPTFHDHDRMFPDRDRAARLSEERSWTEGKTFPRTSLILTDLGSCLRRSTTSFPSLETTVPSFFATVNM